jgi:hypothetical protein
MDGSDFVKDGWQAGLWRITTCTATFTGGTAGSVSSSGVVTIGSGNTAVTVSNAFSADYDNYLITVNGGTSSTNNVDIRLQLGASTTGYFSQLIFAPYSGSLGTPAFVNNGSRFGWSAHGLTDGLSATITLMSPNLARFTRMSAPWHTTTEAGHVSGLHNVAAAYTGFTLIPQAGTMTGGVIRVYGYNN